MMQHHVFGKRKPELRTENQTGLYFLAGVVGAGVVLAGAGAVPAAGVVPVAGG